MFKKVEVSLASAVAANGTFTAAYPEGTTAGDYASYGHSMFSRGLQAMFKQDDGQMSVSFGASDITVTYRGSTSIPAGTIVDIQFNMAGPDDKQLPDISQMKRMNWVSPIYIDLGAPDTADADGILESQNLTSAGVYSVLAFNGVYGDPYSNTKAVLDVPRNVVAAWTGTAVLTVTGKDEYGDIMIESSGSGTSFTGKKAFKEITAISVSANVTSLTVGTGDVLGLPVFVDKSARILAELKDGVALPRKPGKTHLFGRVLCTDGTYGVVYSPVAGVISKIETVEVEGGITTNDAVLTFRIGTTDITNGVVTVATSGSAAGVKDTASPTAANTLAVGDAITVVVSGTPGGSKTVFVTFEVDVNSTNVLDGTFVAGDQTLPTATTGDVRGTYDPLAACNGSLQFGLLVSVPDPTYKGVDNYDG
jgi:hypothetical protein